MFSMKFIVLLVAAIAMVSANHHGLFAGVQNWAGENLEEPKKQLDASLAEVASDVGPSYSVVEMSEARYFYKYKTVLKNKEGEKKCDVEIMSELSLANDFQVTIKCENEGKVVMNHYASEAVKPIKHLK